MKYERPVVQVTEYTAEGIYMASGDQDIAGGNTSACQSGYMRGIYHAPLTNTYGATYHMKDRGCEGCPAAIS